MALSNADKPFAVFSLFLIKSYTCIVSKMSHLGPSKQCTGNKLGAPTRAK